MAIRDLLVGNGTPLLEKDCSTATIATAVAGTAAAAVVLAGRGKFLQHSLQQTLIHMKTRLPAVPLFIGTTSAAACTLAQFRHKEDFVNYAAGSALGGAVLAGARAASPAGFGWNIVVIPASIAVAYLFVTEQQNIEPDLTDRQLLAHGSKKDIYKATWNELTGNVKN